MTPTGEHSAAAPDTLGRLVYAVGDVHGRDDLLEALLGRIAADAADRRDGLVKPPLLVLLGDYIDRGGQSRQVLDRLIALRDDPTFETRLVLGNHEEAMLDFLDHRTTGRGWCRRGGRETFASYGVRIPVTDEDRAGWLATREAFAAAVPPAHVALLRAMEHYVICGDLLFVHAGLRPAVPLPEQTVRDMLWIRSEFLSSDQPFDHYVVHGHTPVEQVHVGPTRTNIDTGAYLSGVLSAVRFDGGPPVVIGNFHSRG